MSNNLSKILNILTYVMIGVTAVLVAMFFLGGEVPDQAHTTPVYTDLFLNWAGILFLVSIVLSLVFPLIQLFLDPKAAIKGLIGLACIAGLIVVSYSMADGALLNIPGYTGPDNNPGTLKYADTMLFTMYALSLGAIASIFITEIVRKFR